MPSQGVLIRENNPPGQRVFDYAGGRIPKCELSIDFIVPVEYTQVVQRNQLFCNTQYLAKGFSYRDYTAPLSFCALAVFRRQGMFKRYLRVESFPVMLLQFLCRPIRSALLAIVAIRLDSFFRCPNEILRKQVFHDIFRLHATLQLLQYILPASMRVDIFVVLE